MEQKTILIVEDDGILAVHLRNMLSGLGYGVPEPVATGEAAIAAVAAKRPDLVLMDIQLAGMMDGIAAASGIRSTTDVPIVFLTGYSQDPLLQRAKTTVPYGYLLKPVSQRELAATIETALYRHTLDRQLKEHKDALQKAHDELELRVQERTADLLSANESLRGEMEKRRRIEDNLRESEERYRRITEGLTDYLYTVHIQDDGKTMRTTHSPACEAVTGYTPEEYTADPHLWMRMVVAEDRDQVAEHIQRTLAGEKTPSLEHRIIHKDGQIRWVSNKLIPQFDFRGIPVTYDGVIKDITERKRAEEQLFNSKATLSMAINGISDPLIMLDARLRIKRLNRAAKKYFGLTSNQEAVGKLCFEAFRGRLRPCEGCERPFSDMRGYSGSYERKGAMDPDRIEHVVVDLVKNKSGTPEASIVRITDITQARMMDRQLVQSEKLASLGLLIAGIAHEINNPNNFIYFNAPILRSYLQFLLPIVDEYVSDHPGLRAFGRPYSVFREDCFKLLDNIEHGSTRIDQIVGNLREFVRERGKGEKRRIDLKQVVEKGISICLGRIKKTVKTFESNIPDELPTLFTDPLAVEQIVVNLLINAAHAADKADSWVKLTIIGQNNPAEEVIVEVSDNGCGMDTETQRKIFDPFFTTKAVGVGTGLGLSISHRLISELGGRIEVRSEVGKGSIFRVILKSTPS
ncbi:MAG: PAS domain S-box protein [Deltaproteobacteria bacterium]|nr:PAS domain S-box protein [Deltaproteobacteria bacterium]